MEIPVPVTPEWWDNGYIWSSTSITQGGATVTVSYVYSQDANMYVATCVIKTKPGQQVSGDVYMQFYSGAPPRAISATCVRLKGAGCTFNITGSIYTNPEPTGLSLGALALAAVGVLRRRKS